MTLRDLTTAGATLDSVVAAGGNAARIDSLAPYVTDPTIAANKARAQAVDIAEAQAAQYAELLGFTPRPGGVGLGVVIDHRTATDRLRGPGRRAGGEGADSDRSRARHTVSVTLNVAWSIE